MHNYSENWWHLQSILSSYKTTHQTLERYSYGDHAKAKALSIFLARATLATPRLDKSTVEKILAARLVWPNSRGILSFEGVALPLSLFEEYGLVSFYGDWCTVHCQSLSNPEKVDPTLAELVRSVEHLKEISFGRNGYIRPHFACSVDELEKHFSEQFLGTFVAELLPELVIEDGYCRLVPGNHNFDSLVSTYLWHTLRESKNVKAAFEHWMLCFRVNCNWAMPVLFEDGDFEQRKEFNNEMLAYIAQDIGLNIPMDWLWKQAINERHFSGIVMPIQTNIRNGLDGSSQAEYEDIELAKTTLVNLDMSYSVPSGDDSNHLKFVKKWRQSGHWQAHDLFYVSLLANAIEADIHIDDQSLVSYGLTEKLIELAASRPILKYVLFNLLPECGKIKYQILLLSQPQSCDIALFFLTQQYFYGSHGDGYSYTQHLEKGYQQLVCHEYVRVLKEQNDIGNRLLSAVVFMGERCALSTRDFSENYEYKFLLCFLENLDLQQVAQLGHAFSECLDKSEINPGQHSQQHYWYLLGFWLIDKLQSSGADGTDTLVHSVKKAVLNHYKAELNENLVGMRRSLEPNFFYSALPWHKLLGNGNIRELLSISNIGADWLAKLRYTNKNNLTAASAIKHYLLVLMCMGRPQRILSDWERVASRVLELVRMLGFGSREDAIYLFSEAFFSNQFDLWSIFCSYTNQLPDAQYEDFVDRCLQLIPLNQLFVLLERCTLITRTQKLQESIAIRQSFENEDLGLNSLEQAFISACDAGHTILATNLLAAAKEILAQDRFANSVHSHILKIRKAWLTYEYKFQLICLLEKQEHSSGSFAKTAHQVLIPHDKQGNSYYENRAQWDECERFRRYIIAASYFETDPAKCVTIMEVLYKETKSHEHSFMLFKGRVASIGTNTGGSVLRNALSTFLVSLDGMTQELMPTSWIAVILDSYRQLQDSLNIDDFWIRLNQDQQSRREIMHPYCMALIERGDALIAQKIINRYRELNQEASEELEITELMDELGKNLPSPQSMEQLVQVMIDESQRSIGQLTNHYNQIVSKDFEGYVAIVGQGRSPDQFLVSVVQEVAQELLLRKKNLHLHQKDSQDFISSRITEEDLINDWFTSLFDKRMAEARVGFRDQKRAGQSRSGKRPGEVDGFITDAKNNRLSIFEAFRIFSLNTTVIFEHLNKIAGYDNESLSPVFIIAYCDVNNFEELVRGYAETISKNDYLGYSVATGGSSQVETQNSTDNLWLGMERRRRGHREIIFYHLLLNMGDH